MNVFLPLLLLAGCGDPLLGGAALDEALGFLGPPLEVAWQLLWYDTSGLGVSCDLLAPASDAWEQEQVVMGEMDVTAPLVDQPEIILSGDGYTWGLALFVLVDQALIEDEEAFSMDPGGASWGLVDSSALLFVDGDTAAFHGDLAMPGDIAPSTGLQWVDLVPEIAALSSSPSGAILPREASKTGVPSLTVENVAYVPPDRIDLFTGAAFGGVHASDCP